MYTRAARARTGACTRRGKENDFKVAERVAPLVSFFFEKRYHHFKHFLVEFG